MLQHVLCETIVYCNILPYSCCIINHALELNVLFNYASINLVKYCPFRFLLMTSLDLFKFKLMFQKLSLFAIC